jgi:serine/threonine protein phosphatase 1
MMQKIFVISDIHGRYEKLLRALELSGYSQSDRLIFLGDYINRGERSHEVVEYLIDMSKNQDNIFLRGNHEEMVLQLSEGESDYWYMWLEYGGGRTCLTSYAFDPDKITFDGDRYVLNEKGKTIPLDDKDATRKTIRNIFPEDHISLMRGMITAYETERFFFSHAGIEKGVPLAEQVQYTDYMLLWGDEEFLDDDTDYGKIIVFGHFHMEEPIIGKNKIMLAIKSDVSVLDLQDMVIVNSAGKKIRIKDIP